MALDRHGQTNTNSSSWEAYKECCHWRKTLGILLSLAVHICRIPILNNAGWTEKNESQTTFKSNIKPLLREKHGWKMTEGPGFEPLWSTKPTMSSAVTEFVQCGCKICTLCIDNHCSCQKKTIDSVLTANAPFVHTYPCSSQTLTSGTIMSCLNQTATQKLSSNE